MAFARADVHTRTPINNITGKVFNLPDAWIGHELLPFLNVARVTGDIYVHGKENLKNENAIKARGATSNTVERTLSKMPFTTDRFGLRALTLDEDVEESDEPIRKHLEDDAEMLAEMVRVQYENAVYTKVTTSANYASGHSTSLANEWDDYTNGDPIGDCRVGRLKVRSAIGRWPNYMAMSATDFESLRHQPDIIERYIYTGGMAAELTTKMVAKVLGFLDIFVGEATQNTGVEGADDSLADVWGENAVIFYRNPTLGKKSSDFGRTLVSKKLRTRTYLADKGVEGTYTDTDWKYGLQWMSVDSPTGNADSVAGYLIANIRT